MIDHGMPIPLPLLQPKSSMPMRSMQIRVINAPSDADLRQNTIQEVTLRRDRGKEMSTDLHQAPHLQKYSHAGNIIPYQDMSRSHKRIAGLVHRLYRHCERVLRHHLSRLRHHFRTKNCQGHVLLSCLSLLYLSQRCSQTPAAAARRPLSSSRLVFRIILHRHRSHRIPHSLRLIRTDLHTVNRIHDSEPTHTTRNPDRPCTLYNRI